MKKFVAVLFVVFLLGALVAPVLAQAQAQIQGEAMPEPLRLDELGTWEYHWGESAEGEWQPAPSLANPPGWMRESDLWLRVTLPQATYRDATLYLGQVDKTFAVFVAGERIYQVGEFDPMMQEGPHGPNFHLIALPAGYEGQTLIFHIQATGVRIGLEQNVYLGNRADLMTMMFNHDMPHIVLGSLFLVLFLIPLVMYLVSRQQRGYLLLAVFMVGAGLCVWLASQVRYLLIPNLVFWEYIPALALNLMLIGLIAFFENIFASNERAKLLLRRLWQFHAVYALIPPLGDVLPLAWLGMVELLILATLAIYDGFHRNVEARIFGFGFAIFAPFMALDGLLSLGLFPLSVFLFHFGMFAVIMALTAILIRRFALVYQELGRTNEAMSRFVPMAFLNILGRKSITDVQLGDQIQTDMTILFSDIRSFTTLSEQMSPQENFRFINDYLRRVSPIIRQNHGFIDKYIGDGVMALFPRCPDDALRAAVEMQQAVDAYNLEREAEGLPPLQIGAGIHTGSLMLGTVGEAERMEGTVISNAVNLASRLEGVTKYYGVKIVASEATLNQLSEESAFKHRFLDRVQVKGKTEPVNVHEIFDGDMPDTVALKSQTRPLFEQAVQAYCQQDFEKACRQIEQVLAQHPADAPAQLYLKRLKALIKNGVPLEWDGVVSLEKL